MSQTTTYLAQAANFGGGFDPVSPLYGEPASSYSNTGLSGSSLEGLESIVSTALGILTIVGAILFIVYFFLAGLKWLTAGGDSGKVQKARDEMVQGVLGLIVMVAAYGIIGLVGTILGLDILNPGQTVFTILAPIL